MCVTEAWREKRTGQQHVGGLALELDLSSIPTISSLISAWEFRDLCDAAAVYVLLHVAKRSAVCDTFCVCHSVVTAYMLSLISE